MTNISCSKLWGVFCEDLGENPQPHIAPHCILCIRFIFCTVIGTTITMNPAVYGWAETIVCMPYDDFDFSPRLWLQLCPQKHLVWVSNNILLNLFVIAIIIVLSMQLYRMYCAWASPMFAVAFEIPNSKQVLTSIPIDYRPHFSSIYYLVMMVFQECHVQFTHLCCIFWHLIISYLP